MFPLPQLFRRTRPDPDAGRVLFAFTVPGRPERKVDPLEAWQALEAACGTDPAELLSLIATDPPPPPPPQSGLDEAAAKEQAEQAMGVYKAAQAKRDAAVVKLADGVCAAFGVDPYKPGGVGGLTRTERVRLAADLAAYLGGLAVAARPFTSSPSPTGSPLPG